MYGKVELDKLLWATLVDNLCGSVRGFVFLSESLHSQVFQSIFPQSAVLVLIIDSYRGSADA